MIIWGSELGGRGRHSKNGQLGRHAATGPNDQNGLPVEARRPKNSESLGS